MLDLQIISSIENNKFSFLVLFLVATPPPSHPNLPAGDHQGSIFGPLFRLLHINDIISNIGLLVQIDDTSLFIIVDYGVIAAGCIYTDLDKISTFSLNETYLHAKSADIRR